MGDDRLSVYENLGRRLDDALARGSQLLDEARRGAQDFRPRGIS